MSDHRETPVRLLLVDDHQLLRMGLKTLFEGSRVVEVIGEAGTAAEAVALSRKLKPDIVLLDLRLPDGKGVDVCREIRAGSSNIRVLFLTSYVDDEAVFATVMAGAQGYLLKEVTGDQLIQSVMKVVGGGSCLDPLLAERAMARIKVMTDTAASTAPALSEQEARVIALVAQGKTNKEVAASMGLNDKTVRNYLTSIFHKLDVTRRSEAIALYLHKYSDRDAMPNMTAS